MTRTRKSRRKAKEDLKVHPWTHLEDAFLLQHYLHHGADWCAKALEAQGFLRTRTATRQRAGALGLRYIGPPLGRFKPGLTPDNKGRKIPSDIYIKLAPTMFKKGNRSGAAAQKYVPIGHETIRADGYTYVKTAEGRWLAKHRLLWEAHNDTIKAGQVLIFRDGNPNNCRLDNLELITRKEFVYRNRWGAGPSEYSLLIGRAARIRLKKRGIRNRDIRANPELLKAAEAETLLSLQTRKRHDRTQG